MEELVELNKEIEKAYEACKLMDASTRKRSVVHRLRPYAHLNELLNLKMHILLSQKTREES